jgi:hypothetical protein
MKFLALPALIAATALPAAALAAPAPAPQASAAATARHYEGTVVSVDRSNRSFRLRDSERGTVRIRVTNSTSFERVAGFSALRSGMTRIEATVRRAGSGWVATHVERSGGGGRHGGGGSDDDR